MLKSEEYEAKDVESLRLGRDADKLAVIEDPAGYAWEVLERHERGVAEPLCKVSCSYHLTLFILVLPALSAAACMLVHVDT